ncbi:peptide ABC transporter substrate-binding protein [Lactococcus lactis]|uniref:peptide ABC transporter substrate-binding protein n=1 Tax=Lactococcus lactis TaxID=1358 RepID=UPI002739409B|nr:peptide ABC transporter substrate-binding protein [Lactococcus lactis]
MNKSKIFAFSAISLSAALLLTACGNSVSKSEDSAQEAKYSFASNILTLDTSMAADVNSIDVLLNVDAGLVRWNPKAQVVNDLAKSINISKDGKTYNVTLRDGLKWSNGAKLRAADFVYGWQRTVDPKTGSQYAYALTPVANASEIMTGKKPVDTLGIKAESDKKLVITLATPTPYFNKLLTLPAYYPVNEAFVKKMGNKYGTSSDTSLYNGAFKFVKGKNNWTGSNETFSIVKNDQFYDAKNVKLSGATYQIVNNPNTAVNLFKSGKLDVANLATPELVSANKKNKDYKALTSPRIDVLEYNQSGKVPELSNLKIRQALNLATNRKNLLEIAAPSFSITNTVTPKKLDQAPNGEDFATYAAQPYKYDAKKAAELFKEGLKELGKTSITLELEGANDNSFAKAAVDYLKGNLEKDLPGLTINEKLVSSAQRQKDAQNNNFQILLTSWGADYNEPSDFLMNFVSGSTMNHGLVKNPNFDKAYQAATTAPDVLSADKRYAHYKDAENALYEAANVNPLATESVSLLLNPKLKGISTYNSAMIFDLRHAEITK